MRNARPVSGKTPEQQTEKKVILRDMVVEQIRQLILTEHLKKGDRLPPERTLSSRFAVSRHLVREALRVLEQQHVVVSRIGSGSYVENADPSRPTEALTEAGLQRRSNLMEILEFRRAVEPRIAYLAAGNAGQDAHENLQAILADMRTAMEKRDTTAWTEADAAFHSYLAGMTGNFLYKEAVGLLHHGMIAFQTTSDILLERQFTASYAAHEAIARAIRAGNGEEAASAMEQHIVTTVQTALEAVTNKQHS